MPTPSTTSAYRFLAEVLLYPEDRDAARLDACAAEASAALPDLRDAIESLLASPELGSCDTYLESFEIGAKAPLYLGHYLFEEPKNCRGAAICGRNGYMIQLKNLYRHFGLQMDGGELPDFLPLLLEFLALTAEHPDQKRRRWMIKHYIRPALPALTKGLTEVNNVYSPLASVLEKLLQAEVPAEQESRTQRSADIPVRQTQPPTESGHPVPELRTGMSALLVTAGDAVETKPEAAARPLPSPEFCPTP